MRRGEARAPAQEENELDHLRGLENPSYEGHLVVLPKSRIRHLLYIVTFGFFLYDAITVPYVAAFWSASEPSILAVNVTHAPDSNSRRQACRLGSAL